MKPTMRRLLMLFCAALLAGCGTGFAPSSIEIDQDRIEAAIAERFPYQVRWLGVVDVRAARPTVRLLPERNRIATDVELTVDERLSAQQLRGALGFEGGLRYEPSDGTLRLADVTVDRLALAGLPAVMSSQTGRLGSVLAEQLLEGAVLYRLNDAQRDLLRRERVRPGAIDVTPRGLRIALVPEGRS